MSAPLSQFRAELKKFWYEHPEAVEALSNAYASSTTNYKACVTHTPDGKVVLDPSCYRTQGAALSSAYAQVWGKKKK